MPRALILLWWPVKVDLQLPVPVSYTRTKRSSPPATMYSRSDPGRRKNLMQLMRERCSILMDGVAFCEQAKKKEAQVD